MLAIPTKGFGKSVNKHNIRLEVLCDWIEGSLLFQDTSPFLSQIDIADVLLEEERYVEQDFALIGMKDAWSELDRRIMWIGPNAAVQIDKRRIQRNSGDWREHSAYTFCLLLSLAPFYDWWQENTYVEQGELFELITEASLKAQFSNWQIYRTGWSKDNTVRLRDLAIEVSEHLGEDLGDVDTWDAPSAKELGLDILCYRAFPDKRRGIPIYMVQCASGDDWDLKIKDSIIARWCDIIHFKSQPLDAFATPFSFLDKEFNKCAKSVQGLFLERLRLIGASRYKAEWVSDSLKERLIAWCEPRIEELLRRSE